MPAFAIVPCPSHSFPNLMALVAASAFTPKASKVARTANRSRNMAILWLAKRHKSITAAPDLPLHLDHHSDAPSPGESLLVAAPNCLCLRLRREFWLQATVDQSACLPVLHQ